MSVSTLGAVDFRSDKERTARKTAKGARASKTSAQEAKKQTALQREQLAAIKRQNELLAQLAEQRQSPPTNGTGPAHPA